jgi:hypothetical protein
MIEIFGLVFLGLLVLFGAFCAAEAIVERFVQSPTPPPPRYRWRLVSRNKEAVQELNSALTLQPGR